MLDNNHIGSNFDSFLEEENILQESEAVALKRVIAYELQQKMKEKNMQKFRNCSPKNGNTGTGNLINLKRQAVKPCASVMNG